jgi:acyl dehydratase
MYYEDFEIGRETETGSALFTRESILAYAERYDPRVVAAEREGRGLIASGLHVASEAMRQFVDWHAAFRAAAAERGESQPTLGVSPGVRDLVWRHPVRPGDIVTFSMRTVSMRETSKPHLGLVGNAFWGLNPRGQEALSFSSLAFAFRRSPESLGE